MREVKTRKKYKCDYCRRTSTKEAMERHEKICFKNPNRFCELCGNEGEYEEHHDEGLTETIACPYCSKFYKQKKEDEKTNNTKEKG